MRSNTRYRVAIGKVWTCAVTLGTSWPQSLQQSLELQVRYPFSQPGELPPPFFFVFLFVFVLFFGFLSFSPVPFLVKGTVTGVTG